MRQKTIEFKLIPLWFLFALCVNKLTVFHYPYVLELFALTSIGLFHGAYDLAYAKKIYHLNSPLKICQFIISYLALALIFIFLWLSLPNFGLLIFYFISVYHFGCDWQSSKWIHKMLLGYTTLSVSFFAHPLFPKNLIETYFVTLSPKIISICVLLWPLCIWLCLAILIRNKSLPYLLAWLSFQMLGFLFTPITYFTIYFCGFHSVKHIREIRKTQTNQMYADLSAILIWFASLSMAILFYFFIINYQPLSALFTFFIILAGLTLPHMYLHSNYALR